jgi:hypothetical protein
MQATKATEQTQDSQRQNTRLDARYGKIGISAVAAAVRHQGARYNRPQSQETENKRD